jgi:hypothetical protein
MGSVFGDSFSANLDSFTGSQAALRVKGGLLGRTLTLRRFAARTTGNLYEAIGEALREVTVQDMFGWFRQGGLCATQS